MKPVSRQEAEYICKHWIDHSPAGHNPPHISTTCKDKPKGKRKKRYVEETPLVKRLLKEFKDKECQK